MTTFPEYDTFDGVGLAHLVQQGVISPDELLQAAIERVETRNPQFNAVIHKMYDQAKATLAQGLPTGAFRGVPFLLKDLLADYNQSPLRSGSRFMYDGMSQQDSEIVRRFKAAGLVIFGKTNTPEFGLSPVTEPVLFGPTHNPWDVTLTPGGSSGGSAAAVAAGMVPMAHGGDGGGSLRIPAAYCGLFGMKPSRGRVPFGAIFMRIWQGMLTEHVITRSVRDSAAMLDAIAGPETGAQDALPKPQHSFLSRLAQAPDPLRIAMIAQPFFSATVSPRYIQALNDAGKLCQHLGHRVESVTLEVPSEEVAYAYLTVIASEMATLLKNLSEQRGRKPRHKELEVLTAVLCQMGERFTAMDFTRAHQVLDRVSKQLTVFCADYDVIMTPTMASAPPRIGALKPDFIEYGMLELFRTVPFTPALRKLMQHMAAEFLAFTPFTPLFNVTGQPAMSVPLYWDEQGLPIGIQFAGHVGAESTLFQLAHQLEQVQPWAEKRPTMWCETTV